MCFFDRILKYTQRNFRRAGVNNKISTIDEGLRYLYQARKECRNSFFTQAKLGVFRFLLGRVAAAGIFSGAKAKDNGNAPEANIQRNRRGPWRTLAYIACVSCLAGMITGKILSRKGRA
jgi:hypothetical protein